jgi:TetR/AcrR family transcriptional regulator, transcriptional repressor of aconitase
MPKVSQEHLDQRRQQILDAAVECFARQGYHGTSMQDIFAAADLSAGAVYRYFPSKACLFRAISSEVLCGTRSALDSAIAACDSGAPVPSVADVVALMVHSMASGPLAAMRPVIVEAWAEASRDPELRAQVVEAFSQLIARFSRLLDLHVAAGRLPQGTDTAGLARLILATLQGYMAQYAALPEPAEIAAAARAAFGEI